MLRVTAYCRVSTDSDDQNNSYENQRDYFKEYIKSNGNWQYVPLYADKGISGTQTKNRDEFNRMIEDAESGKFDLILTKSVTRAFRNAVDALTIARSLKNIGVHILFMSDGVDTREKDYELRLGIMSSLAQEESRQTSERVKWGQQRSMKKGVIFGNGVLGYTIIKKNGKNSHLVIDPVGSETVRTIFDLYLNKGMGLKNIAIELENDGRLTGCGRTKWDASAVRRILHNDKYQGDLKQGKSYTDDYITHRTIRNKGEKPLIKADSKHEPIIAPEIFSAAQAELARRSAKTAQKVKSRYTNRYAFSGKLKCGLCCASLISRPRKSQDEKRNIQRWQCGRYFKYGAKQNNEQGCVNSMIRNEIIEGIVLLALKDIVAYKDVIIDECVTLLSSVLSTKQVQNDHTETKGKIKMLQSRIGRLIELRLDGEISKEELQSKRKPLDLQIAELTYKLEQIKANASLIDTRDVLLDAIKKRVSSLIHANEYSDEVAGEILEKIVIHNKAQYSVYFKGLESGVTLGGDGCN